MDSASLEKDGWFISEEALSEIKEYIEKPTKQNLVNYLLNNDMKEYGSGWLADIKIKSSDNFAGSGILQLTKLRNVAAPLSDETNQAAPPLLRLTLNDGKSSISALCFSTSGAISMKTPPGTKIKLRSNCIPIKLGFLLLESKNGFEVLGGKVSTLISNWELKEKMSKYKHSARIAYKEGGPPPFVPFGTKINAANPNKGFKSMETVKAADAQNNDGSGDVEDLDFCDKRKAEISQARQGGAGVKQFVASAESKFAQRQIDKANEAQLLDRHMAELMSMGFNPRDANRALKMANNDFQLALDNLVSGKFYEQLSLKIGEERGARRGGRGGGNRGRRKGGAFMDDDDDGPPIDTGPVAKPSSGSTLGDFFTAQMPANGCDSQRRTQSAANIIVRPGFECKAQWMNGQYYRVRVNSIQPNGMITVTYLDFNDTQPVPLDLLRTNDDSKISPHQVSQPTSNPPPNRYSHQDDFQPQQYERRGRGRGGGYRGRGNRGGGYRNNDYHSAQDNPFSDYNPYHGSDSRQEQFAPPEDSGHYRVNSAPHRGRAFHRGNRGRGGYY